MRASFPLDHSRLLADPSFREIAERLAGLSPIDSQSSFNSYCREACRLSNERANRTTSGVLVRFDELARTVKSGGANVIQTNWGGVVITLHEPPQVEKYLVIRKGGFLALEKHEKKDEGLEVREGQGLLLWRQKVGKPLMAQAIGPGDEFHLSPGREHCLIGADNLLVFERSIDPKGMDQDLIFIYTPESP
jgi:hypothetical protein